MSSRAPLAPRTVDYAYYRYGPARRAVLRRRSARPVGGAEARVAPMTAAMDRASILLTGATGCIGGRLLQALEARGDPVRCMTRHPGALAAQVGPRTGVVFGDCLDPASLAEPCTGIDTAYYLVHSMGGTADFAARDRAAAQHFGAAARAAGVRRIVYVGGLGAAAGLSRHLRSRHETGDVLRQSGVPVIELRSGIVLGPGSLSFELIRALVERLPVMLCPSWVRTPTQPIALADLVAYLVAVLDLPHGASRRFDVGGGDVVSYDAIMREYARQRGLRRWLISVPLLTPHLSSLWLGLTTPVYARVGRELVDGLRTATVVEDDAARTAFPIQPLGLRAAIARAIEEEDESFTAQRWSAEALATGTALRWGRHARPLAARRLARRRSAGRPGGGVRADPAHRRSERLVLRRLAVAPARSRRPARRRRRPRARPARRRAPRGRRHARLLARRDLRAGRAAAPRGRDEAAGPRLAGFRGHSPRGRILHRPPDRGLRCTGGLGPLLLARPLSRPRPAVRRPAPRHRPPGDRRGREPAPRLIHEIHRDTRGTSWFVAPLMRTPIPRAAEDRLRRALARSPVVALVGPRQCGKTTLARQLVAAGASKMLYGASGAIERSGGSFGVEGAPPASACMLERLPDPGDDLPPWLTAEDVDTYVQTFTKSGFRGGLNWYRNIDHNWVLTATFDGMKIEQPALFVTGDRDVVPFSARSRAGHARRRHRSPRRRRPAGDRPPDPAGGPGCGERRPAAIPEGGVAGGSTAREATDAMRAGGPARSKS